ncbi:hypothetical protein Q1695_009487 [Nippostrongylus brasiliensis]|nr:hypothetical protein Q1695_009487 [Nippostrongylus brasiliensis]
MYLILLGFCRTSSFASRPIKGNNACGRKSIGFGTRRDLSSEWKSQLIGKVNQHSLDNSSLEMKIAWMTALIRHWSMIVDDIAKKTPKYVSIASADLVSTGATPSRSLTLMMETRSSCG